jgi:hypothetical protein
MILGLSLPAFTTVHVIISLVAIAAGLVVVFGMLGNQRLPGWTALFLLTTILTSATGFLFPFTALQDSHKVGILSLVVLAIALIALYVFHLGRFWRWVYIVTALVALYLNVFVGVVQAFRKIPALHSLAPTESEPPFLIGQLVVLAIFVVLGFLTVRRFHPAVA